MITYDKGASWDKFGKPMNCGDDSNCGCNTTSDSYCHLQVHCAFSMSKGVKVPEGPYSTENVSLFTSYLEGSTMRPHKWPLIN